MILTGAVMGLSAGAESDIELNLKTSLSPAIHDSLYGTVMCGYQGWFTCPGDGTGKGWYHWGNSIDGKFYEFKPGACSIDAWPDMSEYEADEKFETDFVYPDGSKAYVFSSAHPKTVDRHFKWMNEYGIDGVFLQRFGVELTRQRDRYHANTVLENVKKAANAHGRSYAVMYDLSNLEKGEMVDVVNDWKNIVDYLRITRDKFDRAYQFHNGKPVVAIWGIGFRNRQYTLEECRNLVKFFKDDPHYGGNTIMLGVPTHWRQFGQDCIDDPEFHDIIKMADIVSPWMVGRFGRPQDVKRFAETIWQPDMQWCDQYQKDYFPVVFPGFSWANLMKKDDYFNTIPRRKGEFLWTQYHWLCKIGVKMIYQAMFDEVDEATSILKTTDTPPVGASKFLTNEGLPSDHYLWLVGQGGQMLRGEIPLTETIPTR
jgi:hypothetical protein